MANDTYIAGLTAEKALAMGQAYLGETCRKCDERLVLETHEKTAGETEEGGRPCVEVHYALTCPSESGPLRRHFRTDLRDAILDDVHNGGGDLDRIHSFLRIGYVVEIR